MRASVDVYRSDCDGLRRRDDGCAFSDAHSNSQGDGSRDYNSPRKPGGCGRRGCDIFGCSDR